MTKEIFIAGPCVIESKELLDTVAQELVKINKELDRSTRLTAHQYTHLEDQALIKVCKCWAM